MADSFHELIGWFIHHCGAIELLTNNAIKALAQDSLLSSKIIEWPFSRRLGVLRELLDERMQLPKSDVKSLCDELAAIAQRRNAVAHNPVASNHKDLHDPFILVVRYAQPRAEVKEKVTHAELEALVDRSKLAMERFAKLVPSSMKA